MFSRKNNVISELTFYDIKKATRALKNAQSIQGQREIMSYFIDPVIVQELDDNTAYSIFEKINWAVERKIRSLIKEKTGQTDLKAGTKVRLTCDCDGFEAGTEGTIKECVRFEEDTFGQGWYVYRIGELPRGCQILSVYASEFEVIEA